ncbi:MAG: phage tail protein [Chloroflexales bacterium]
MPQFTVNTHRFDPYRNFKFKIKIDNQYVAGLSKCSALKKSTEMVEWWGDVDHPTSRKLPGKTKYEAITLDAGVTHDTLFEEWANKVNNFQGAAAMSLRNFRKDYITIDVFNLQGKVVLSYIVYRCWVAEYQALPELDAGGNAVMIQHIKLENEGWERDHTVTEPKED